MEQKQLVRNPFITKSINAAVTNSESQDTKAVTLHLPKRANLFDVGVEMLKHIASYIDVIDRANLIANTFFMNMIYSNPIDLSSIELSLQTLKPMLLQHTKINITGLNIGNESIDTDLQCLRPVVSKLTKLSLTQTHDYMFSNVEYDETKYPIPPRWNVGFLFRGINLKELKIAASMKGLTSVSECTNLVKLDITVTEPSESYHIFNWFT